VKGILSVFIYMLLLMLYFIILNKLFGRLKKSRVHLFAPLQRRIKKIKGKESFKQVVNIYCTLIFFGIIRYTKLNFIFALAIYGLLMSLSFNIFEEQ